MIKKICVITGTRAEYGLLAGLMKEIKSDPDLNLQIVACSMHLSPEFGLTYQDIEKDGFHIDKKVEMLLSSDTSVGISKSMGLALISFGEVFSELQPDIIVLLGDRFETFCAASAASVSRIPIAHIHGGETTIGAVDEAFRHSITKMSHLHFTSTEIYRRRVIQLGEYPDRVFNIGALGVENIPKMALLSKKELEREIQFELGDSYILVTFHPATLEQATAEEQFGSLLNAIESISQTSNLRDQLKNLKVIFTKANADAGGRIINQMIDNFVAVNPANYIAFTSMGQLRYLSAMKHAAAVLGNSSSGIIEAPSFKVPTVNIGDRQKGRVKAKSIIDCEPTTESISHALTTALSPESKESLADMVNPYEKEDSARNIKDIIKNTRLNMILKKSFMISQAMDEYSQISDYF